jgi:hypothetical protein
MKELIFFHCIYTITFINVITEPSFAQNEEYRLDRKPFISSRIIQELSTWISDGGDQIVEMNLDETQGSNRYFGDIQTTKVKDGLPYVFFSDTSQHFTNPLEFGYQFKGKTSNGISVIHTYDREGGSGLFENLMLLTFIKDTGVSFNEDTNMHVKMTNKPRTLIRKITEIALGDRWGGTIKIEDNKLIIHQKSTQDTGNDDELRVYDLSKIPERLLH